MKFVRLIEDLGRAEKAIGGFGEEAKKLKSGMGELAGLELKLNIDGKRLHEEIEYVVSPPTEEAWIIAVTPSSFRIRRDIKYAVEENPFPPVMRILVDSRFIDDQLSALFEVMRWDINLGISLENAEILEKSIRKAIKDIKPPPELKITPKFPSPTALREAINKRLNAFDHQKLIALRLRPNILFLGRALRKALVSVAKTGVVPVVGSATGTAPAAAPPGGGMGGEDLGKVFAGGVGEIVTALKGILEAIKPTVKLLESIDGKTKKPGPLG